MLLPKTEERGVAAVIPCGVALGLLGRFSGSVSTSYALWSQNENRPDVIALGQHPGQRKLRRRAALLGGDRIDLGHKMCSGRLNCPVRKPRPSGP